MELIDKERTDSSIKNIIIEEQEYGVYNDSEIVILGTIVYNKNTGAYSIHYPKVLSHSKEEIINFLRK